MTFRQFAVPFALGIVAGVLVARNWERIRTTAAPVARRVARRAKGVAEKGREAAWEARERFEDRMAEMREKEATT